MTNVELISPQAEILLKALPDWQNRPKLSELKEDLTAASSIHNAQKTKIATWLDNLNVEGSAKVNTPKGSSSVVPKLIRKQAEWRYGALSEPFLSTSDLFNVKPVTWEDREAAMQNQLLLNYQFNHAINKQKFIDEYVRTAVDEGTVILRTGWDYHEEVTKEVVPVVEFTEDQMFAETLDQISMAKEENPGSFFELDDELQEAHNMYMSTGVPYRPDIVGYEEEEITKVIKNKPTVHICDHRNVLIDPTCLGDIDKASFVIYSFESSLAELQKDGRYVNLEYLNVDNNSILGAPDFSSPTGAANFQFNDKPRKKIAVYEYWGFWDKEGDGVLKPIVVTWVGDTIIRMEDNPYPDGKLPFVVVQYLPVRKEIYGEPDGSLLEDNQKINGALVRGMIDIMGKSANAQTGVRKDFLDATNFHRFEQGQDYRFNPNVDPSQAVYMHKFAEIPQSALTLQQLMNMEAESLTGVKAYSQGIASGSLGDVAAGIRGALDAASKRELGILRRLSHGLVQVARKFIAMNSDFLGEEEVIRVTNEEFVRIKRDDLSGEFDLELGISTAEEDNNKAQELAFMMQTIGNSMGQDLMQMIMADIARLRKMPDLAHKIETFKPEPDPVQQMMQQLEMKRMELEVAELQAKIQKLNTAAQLDIAKVQDLGADVDRKSLDFVEQESGVTQNRQLQLQGEQARSQAQTKVVDHQLKMREIQAKGANDYMVAQQKANKKPAD